MPNNGKHNGSSVADLDHPRQPEVTGVEVEGCAARALRESMMRSVERMRQCDPAVREGVPEGVHGMRTSTRRLRSTLRTFRDLLEGDWSGPLESELKWLAGLLGAVRDLDVLEDRLQSAAGKSKEKLGLLFRVLDDRRREAAEALERGLGSERYRTLLDRLAEASAHPSLRESADGPCRPTLTPMVADAWKSLKKRGRELGRHDPDEDFHETRKRAKRARYAAESVADALKPRRARQAKRFARMATRVQDVLGEHQDATVASQEIARIITMHSGEPVFERAASRLKQRQDRAADRARDRFFKIWKRLDRKKLRRWLKP